MFRCDFENGFCGWKQDNTENADWVLTMGLAKSEGPSMDHTKDNKMGLLIFMTSLSFSQNLGLFVCLGRGVWGVFVLFIYLF